MNPKLCISFISFLPVNDPEIAEACRVNELYTLSAIKLANE
jgi:hypothetical protein